MGRSESTHPGEAPADGIGVDPGPGQVGRHAHQPHQVQSGVRTDAFDRGVQLGRREAGLLAFTRGVDLEIDREWLAASDAGPTEAIDMGGIAQAVQAGATLGDLGQLPALDPTDVVEVGAIGGGSLHLVEVIETVLAVVELTGSREFGQHRRLLGLGHRDQPDPLAIAPGARAGRGDARLHRLQARRDRHGGSMRPP